MQGFVTAYGICLWGQHVTFHCLTMPPAPCQSLRVQVALTPKALVHWFEFGIMGNWVGPAGHLCGQSAIVIIVITFYNPWG